MILLYAVTYLWKNMLFTCLKDVYLNILIAVYNYPQ